MKSRVLIVMFFIIGLCYASRYGKITGTVIDAETGEPLVACNVLLFDTLGNFLGKSAATDWDGNFFIIGIKPGIYQIECNYVGYSDVIIENIRVLENEATKLNIEMEGAYDQILAVEVGVICNAVNYQYRGSRSTNYSIAGIDKQRKKKSQDNGYSSSLTYVNINNIKPINTAKESDTLKIDGEQNSYSNDHDEPQMLESDFVKTISSPLSTFSIDVDAASYSLMRSSITDNLKIGSYKVRIEELINYFDYDYPDPEDEKPISVSMGYTSCPWNDEHRLVEIGIQAKELKAKENKANNLVFLIDVSGSMEDIDKLPLFKESFPILVENLDKEDRVSIVTYAGSFDTPLSATPGNDKQKILKALYKLNAEGSTNGEGGINAAYRIAEENFIKSGNNRIVMVTDGDFNVGISSNQQLEELIEEKREKSIFLTILGFGRHGYQDSKMQALAQKGNGTNAYIDNLTEARRVLDHELDATLYTVAKDVKLQIEFNPAKVKEYRLIGYDTRKLEDEDFDNDAVDAGDMGAGHTVTAIYEIVPADSLDFSIRETRYTSQIIKPEALNSSELLTMKIRYKKPNGKKSKKLEFVLNDDFTPIENASNDFKWAASVAEFGLILRDSKYKADASFDSALKLARESIGDDPYGLCKEFIELIEKAKVIYGD